MSTYLYIYISCVCFYCFDCSYSLTCCLCLFPPTVLYHQQWRQLILYQYYCHHDSRPSKWHLNTASAVNTTAAGGTRADNGNANGNRDTQTTTCQSRRTRTDNSPLLSTTMSARPLSRALPTRPSLQVQPEHHSSSNTYNRNAIRQWQSWHTEWRTAVTQAASSTCKWYSRPWWLGASNNNNSMLDWRYH